MSRSYRCIGGLHAIFKPDSEDFWELGACFRGWHLFVGEMSRSTHFLGVSYELTGSPLTYDLMRQPEYAAAAMKPQAAFLPLFAATSEAPALIDRISEDLKTSGPLPPGFQDQFDLKTACLRDDSAPDLEIIGFATAISTAETGKRHITVLAALNHPFSRGTIHAKSSDSFDNPSIDPYYFENDFELLVQHIKYIRTMSDTEPFNSGVLRGADPGPKCVTDQDIREFLVLLWPNSEFEVTRHAIIDLVGEVDDSN
ncbi:hypothetical protein C8R44DRAFT_725089 [Mycena epipterygia]|nr:hypothetical protein C8R44DRAFT_725089 [Mycena epipterygia]